MADWIADSPRRWRRWNEQHRYRREVWEFSKVCVRQQAGVSEQRRVGDPVGPGAVELLEFLILSPLTSGQVVGRWRAHNLQFGAQLAF
jgi:hypothetical protein